jgi:DnaJ-domain-containing protein 1
MINTPGKLAIDLLHSLSPNGESHSYDGGKQAVALAALNHLNPNQREVLILFYANGNTYEEISSKMGLDLIAVQKLRDATFHQFITVLRERHWVKKKRGKWFLRLRAAARAKRKPVQNAYWDLPKWPANFWEAHRVLGISVSASFRLKRVAYLRMVRLNHPDYAFTLGDEAKNRAEEGMKRINRAWEMICADTAQCQ